MTADSSRTLERPAAEASTVTPVRSVARAVDILIVLGDGPRQLGELSAEVSLSKATTYRILSTLKQKGMVIRTDASGEYRLGPGCFGLMSSLVERRAGFPFDADADLRALREATQETITVHVRTGQSRLCIEELPSPQPIRYVAGLGVTVGIHIGSAGKVLLAFMPDEEREELLATLDLRPMTPSTVTDMKTLRAELAEARERGVAFSRGERVVGAVGVSAPVLDERSHVVAALSVLAPAERTDDTRLDEFAGLVRRTAAEISARIGAR